MTGGVFMFGAAQKGGKFYREMIHLHPPTPAESMWCRMFGGKLFGASQI